MFALLKGNLDSGIWEFLFVESRIRENFAYGIRNPEFWNLELH